MPADAVDFGVAGIKWQRLLVFFSLNVALLSSRSRTSLALVAELI